MPGAQAGYEGQGPRSFPHPVGSSLICSLYTFVLHLQKPRAEGPPSPSGPTARMGRLRLPPTFWCLRSFSDAVHPPSRSRSAQGRSSSGSRTTWWRLTRAPPGISRTRTTLGMRRAMASQPCWSMTRSNSCGERRDVVHVHDRQLPPRSSPAPTRPQRRPRSSSMAPRPASPPPRKLVQLQTCRCRGQRRGRAHLSPPPPAALSWPSGEAHLAGGRRRHGRRRRAGKPEVSAQGAGLGARIGPEPAPQ